MTGNAVLRVERGSLTDEELAAVTAVLAARLTGARRAAEPGTPPVRRITALRPVYRSPVSWQQAA